MEISLIRHGRSIAQHNQLLSYGEFLQWLDDYDHRGIIFDNQLPTNTLTKTKDAEFIITSTLKRSIDSAKYLNPKAHLVSTSLFDEVHISFPDNQFREMRLTPVKWMVLLIMYIITHAHHFNRNIDNEIRRAKKAAESLHRLAKKHQTIIVVGHGIYNFLVGEQLNLIGWKSSHTPKANYWGCTTYFLDQN